MDAKATLGDDGLASYEWSRARQLRVLGVSLLVILAAALCVFAASRLFAKTPGATAESDSPLPPGEFRATAAQLADLTIEPVKQMAFRTQHVTEGKIALNGDKTTPVFSPYSGRVLKVLVPLGATVREGTPLLAVAASEFVQGQNDLIDAVAQFNLMQANAKRKQALYESKGGSLQDWQQAQADLVNAANALASVRGRLRILGKTDKEIEAMEHAQTIDPVAYVLAPIGGVVTDRQVGPGQYIQSAASTPVYTIGDLATVWMVANVRETDAPYVRRGEPVEVHVLALPDRVFKANLTYVAPSVDPVTRRLAVHAEIANPEGLLKPEMFATFTIASGNEARSLAVPNEAIVYEGESARVWVAGPDHTLGLRPVRVGRSGEGIIEVLAGLDASDKVVTSGSLFIDRAAKHE
jgi:cobalt-zinc-cadmium efflux system membrane fusion protein